ncbi:hypothetical protein F4553_002431 [Allocatelliglobosispora scoriae]|uniref:Uncharacterized protein n=1 Tax=Allocatelliglobosispora scoriae TaxID=643052 RepID=A0A841BQM4_9ACTN|nr:hypothetical protein [Allocatelliglobosispora scoriae]MBB5869052.1 hypothetical protein [Allocatelliglobosispora scoriae]
MRGTLARLALAVGDLSALRRGTSGSGPTGLVPSIAQRVAGSVGGRLETGRSPALDGARIALHMGAA